MRLIDADKAIKKYSRQLGDVIEETGDTFHEDAERIREIMKAFDRQPTMQPQGIDKDRLIEELKKQNKHAIEIYEKSNDVEFLHYSTALETAIAIADEMPTTDGWIPVSERLPEVKKRVLVTYRHTQGYEYNEIAYRGEDGEWYSKSFDWLLGNDSVIAWQPLPQPYKESE